MRLHRSGRGRAKARGPEYCQSRIETQDRDVSLLVEGTVTGAVHNTVRVLTTANYSHGATDCCD